jgi:putative molybdopterin biosynthesis protein
MALVHANAYLHVPAGTGGIGEGTEVEILPTGQCREQDEICKPTPEQPVQDRKETFSVKDGT